jgi:Zn finger protein HypA/HybF involved in hydrogenase expression
MAKDDDEEVLKKVYAEEALDRKAKATVQWNYNCSIKAAKFKIKKEPLIKQINCEKCGKIFKTNRSTKLCFSCERKK